MRRQGRPERGIIDDSQRGGTKTGPLLGKTRSEAKRQDHGGAPPAMVSYRPRIAQCVSAMKRSFRRNAPQPILKHCPKRLIGERG